MQWLDKKYVQLLSARLDGFKWKSPDLADCRCPLCGDSKTNKKKKRGYFYTKQDHFYFFCHNGCGQLSIKNLLQKLDYSLYQQYQMEQLTSKNQKEPDVAYKTNIAIKYGTNEFLDDLKKLQKLSQLSQNHPAKVYIESRKLPILYHSIFRWCPNFMTWTNTLKPEKFDEKNLRYDEGRILIPFFDQKNEFFAYTGRAISDTKQGLRYILIVLDYNKPMIYGLNTTNLNKQIYAFEGPIDSIFIPNSIALIGQQFSALTSIKNSDIIIVYDNEPRSIETKKKILNAITLGYKVCIWPKWVNFKDINQMIMNNWSSEYIKEVIDDNTFTGFEAKIKLEAWSLK